MIRFLGVASLFVVIGAAAPRPAHAQVWLRPVVTPPVGTVRYQPTPVCRPVCTPVCDTVCNMFGCAQQCVPVCTTQCGMY